MLLKYLSISSFVLGICFLPNQLKAQQSDEKFIFYNKLCLSLSETDNFELMLNKLIFEEQKFRGMQVYMHTKKEKVIFICKNRRFRLHFDKLFAITKFLSDYQKQTGKAIIRESSPNEYKNKQ